MAAYPIDPRTDADEKPLHPEPTVEVRWLEWIDADAPMRGDGSRGFYYRIGGVGSWHGSYSTRPAALQAARLAYLGARLRKWRLLDGSGIDYTVERESDGKPLASGPTPAEAIAAAFAARDPKP